jgi:hypothetical protein
MRRFRPIVSALACVGALAAVVATPTRASTSNFSATFQLHYGRGVAPPPCNVDFCFTGSIAGLGAASLSGTVTGVTPIDDTPCATASYVATVEAAGGSLELTANGTLCPIGNSGSAPGSATSYGNPVSLRGSYTIVDGSGVFAGASGSGSFLDHFAGDVQTLDLNGTLALP